MRIVSNLKGQLAELVLVIIVVGHKNIILEMDISPDIVEGKVVQSVIVASCSEKLSGKGWVHTRTFWRAYLL